MVQIMTVLVLGWGEVLGDRMGNALTEDPGNGYFAAIFRQPVIICCASLGSLVFVLVQLGFLGVHIWDLMMNVNGVLPIFGKHLKFGGFVAWIF